MLQALYTLQGEQLQGTPWQIYPRPQMVRDSYVNLNGTWDFSVTQSSTPPQSYNRTVQVPFCPESLLSGVKEHFPEGSCLWYKRSFILPENFNQGRVLLHVGAADQNFVCYVNHEKAGSHQGGYTNITVDITDYLAQDNLLEICCTDDLRDLSHPYGKQTLQRGGMWYTPVSGIWQTVWLESVPENYIRKLNIENRGHQVTVTTEPAMDGRITVTGEGEYSLINGKAVIRPDTPHLWSPEDPYLYRFTVEAGKDRIESYFALRTLETRTVNGIPRLCLNGNPFFFHGLRDQGYWPDGIYTPAAPECYAEDILAMKALGFNTLRKHIKVEPEEFYYQCDRLGMLVFQDMVNNGDYNYLRDTVLPTIGVQKLSDKRMHRNKAAREGFLATMTATVNQLKNHPCIVYWTIFNEGWGQFDSDNVYEQFRKLDDTRFIDSTSGWFRQKKSDVESLHIYFGPWSKLKLAEKPLVLSEFGGHTYAVEGHLFHPEKAYGYKTCKTNEAFQASVENLYRSRILPAVSKGLCAAIYTQVSDVEDEINGLLTYDRKVCKVDRQTMLQLAKELTDAVCDPVLNK